MWKMRIFEIEHEVKLSEWISGRTLLHALDNYINTTECSLSDLMGAEIFEIPEEDWVDYHIKHEDGTLQSFEDWIKENDKFPEIISGTMYE